MGLDELVDMSRVIGKTLLIQLALIETIHKEFQGRLQCFWTARKTARAARQASQIVAQFGVIGFAISAISLVFLQTGFKVPVTHHITLTAAVAAAASGSLIWGALFGLIAAFLGEFFSRLFLVYGDIHIDPPACAIATLTSLSAALSGLGVYAALALP